VVVPANEAVPNPLLRQAREARNLTQDEVADGLVKLGAKGATGGLVSKWERGICRPNRFHRRLLCQFFAAGQAELGLSPDAPHAHAPLLSRNSVGLLAHAGDAAVAPGRSGQASIPGPSTSSMRMSIASRWNARPCRMPSCSLKCGTTGSRSSSFSMPGRA
jgi:transcriptional regulator with XRE-family HTH domain